MLKKTDKLIIQSFFGLFILAFSIVLFILLLVFMQRYFEDLVGKDLGALLISKLFFYFSLTLIPQALPLSVLLSSLMAFGSLGENYELVALKSLGIPLTRLFVPIGFIAVFISVFSFLFSNYTIPKVNLKAFSLMYDVRQKKPTLDFVEGAFYNGILGWSIRVGQKAEDGIHLRDLMIYDHTKNRGNINLITAKRGTMEMVHNDQYLLMNLQKGYKFTEQKTYTNSGKSVEGFVREDFDSASFMFSLEDFGLQETPEELFKGNRHMKNVVQLQEHADSLFDLADKRLESSQHSTQNYYDYQFSDKYKAHKHVKLDSTKEAIADITQAKYTIKGQDLSPNLLKSMFERAINKSRSIRNIVIGHQEQMQNHKREARRALYYKQQKFTLAISCFLMFLIGAPLGAIIKKGGLGTPVLISIMFFVFYYVMDSVGSKLSRQGAASVITAAWLGNWILFGIGAILLNQARNDSRIFETDVYYMLFDKIKNRFFKKKKKD